jgi:hypothetical protein
LSVDGKLFGTSTIGSHPVRSAPAVAPHDPPRSADACRSAIGRPILKVYDNLIFDTRTTTEYTGRRGVLDLQNTFGLSIDKALEVSDHNPVWAGFRPWETRQVAGTPSSGLMQ